MHKKLEPKKIMVAMSGGVDSSVAALLLKEAGNDVVGVTMCFNVQSGQGRKPSCCGIDGIEDAKRVAGQIGIPHYVLNLGKELEEAVVQDFVVEYISGRTPNPCVRCNQYLKFGALLKKAKASGIRYIATGHFARTQNKGRQVFLKKGLDSKKDQSYFLCNIKRKDLGHILFPLGELTKDEVRGIAKKRGLCVADKIASQEVCFIPDNDYRTFLKTRLNQAYFKKGDIVDLEGNVLGHHNGIFNYTIGQREGLGISAAFPLYVIRLDESKNRVIVGKKQDVFSKGLVAIEPNVLAPALLKKSARLSAKIRYNHQQTPVRLKVISKGKLEVEFHTPQAAVTPGQFLVLYKDDIVVAGAKIINSF